MKNTYKKPFYTWLVWAIFLLDISIFEWRDSLGSYLFLLLTSSIIVYPITKRMLLVARPYCSSDQNYFEVIPVKRGMVNGINHLICFSAERFVYASSQSQELLNYVKESKGYCKKNRAYRFGDAIIQQWDMNFPV